ncbi:MAG: sialate O-acetylesterase [Sarcina sp.]
MLDVILLIGQSNAKGCGNPEESVIPNEHCYEYLKSITGEAVIPMGVTLQISDGCGTIAPAFSNRWNELTGNNVCFIHYAVDGARIKNWNHDKFFLLNEAIEKFNKGIERVSKNFEINKRYAIWIQGESDGKYGTDPIYYRDRLMDIAENLYHRCNIEKMFVSLIGYWEGSDDNLRRCENIAAMQKRTCELSNKLCLASNLALTFKERELTIDEVHYCQEALNELGVDIANNMFYYYNTGEKPILKDMIDMHRAKSYIEKLEEIQ